MIYFMPSGESSTGSPDIEPSVNILFFHDKIKMAEAYAVKRAYTPSGINDFFDRVHCLSFETCI